MLDYKCGNKTNERNPPLFKQQSLVQKRFKRFSFTLKNKETFASFYIKAP